MCCVNPSTTVSTTSSQRGQIVSSESTGWPSPHSDGPPPSPPPANDAGADEEFDSRQAKRPRAESRGGGGGGGDAAARDGRDRLSELPDAILLSVMSYLPLRDAGRSTVLSSRWRRLFDQSLLDFNACQPFPPEGGRGCEWVIRAIDDILAARRRILIRSFRFVMYGQGFINHVPTVGRWFRTLARRGVRELDVDMLYTVPKPPLPASLLHFASLETLRVCYCNFPDAAPAGALRLPALKTLNLSNVGVSQQCLQEMLSHCPSLESAKLKNITGVDKICLRSKSLIRLLGDFGYLNELVVEDAPNLEELVGIGLPSRNATVKIVYAPKLQVLGYLGKSVRPLVLHDTVFDVILGYSVGCSRSSDAIALSKVLASSYDMLCIFQGGIVRSRTLMCSVKTLAIQVPFSEKGYSVFVAQLLKCFPRLETLYVEPDSRSISRWRDVEEWDTTSIQCIEHSITKLVFEYFGRQWCQWGFLTFLLRTARALKVVELYCPETEKWVNKQIETLRCMNKVSPNVEFLFFRSCEPVGSLYLCRCCPRRCHKENRVSLL